MYARIERFNLAQGFVELAEQLADRVARIMTRQPGFQRLSLLSDETSGEYLFLTYWDSLEQIDRYERSADEWRVRDILSPHLTAVPIISTFQRHELATALESATPAPAPVSAMAGVAGGPGMTTTATAVADLSAAVPGSASEPAGQGERGEDLSLATTAVSETVARAQTHGGIVAEGERCSPAYPVKGNHSRSGDFIYHVPGSAFYDRTVPEVCFASEAQAQAAGFRAPRSRS